ncbi:hypothetical protein APHAL10511_006163 [Amanita phalloides]|nr:hypothetical protein APHAL10511_006163 [Amanita phalloides]
MLHFSSAVRTRACCLPLLTRRNAHTNYELKYAEKLQERARAQGINMDDLKRKVKDMAREERRLLHEQVTPKRNTSISAENSVEGQSTMMPPMAQKERKDSTPVKALSSILDVSRIIATPHTAAQVSALWNTYHSSRSGGTGRGFVCASIPVDIYKRMAAVGKKYPSFVVPVPRPQTNPEPQCGEGNSAFEFYYLQWDFHSAPPVPTATNDPFLPPEPSNNPPISTVLFTPLQEYKSRTTFATPYLVLTHYTDLVDAHGIVLLRGEITPNSNSIESDQDKKYMLTQSDAQLLSMAVQKFYLWEGRGQNGGYMLLKQFHEEPMRFRWENLLDHAGLEV